MNSKKVLIVIFTFLLGILFIIGAGFAIVGGKTGKKITPEKFKEIIIKDGCNISDEQNNKTGNIKTQLISMDYGCPYNISYLKFRNKDYQKEYVESNINKINYNNGHITTRINITIFGNKEVRTIGDAYNIIISKDDMVVIATSPKENKEKLNQVINKLGISNKIAWDKIWLLIPGILLIWVSIILLVIFLIRKNKKSSLSR